jgi:signal transduction histidine kinase/ActR/RegA family two-component response regulator
MLTEFAVRSEPFAKEMFQAWNEIYRATHAPPTAFEEALRAFFSELKQANLHAAYAAFGAWGTEAARARVEYDTALQLVRDSQRAILPFVLRAYDDAPHLPLLLDALGAAFDALVTVTSAAYIAVAPERWADRVATHTAGQLAGGAAHALNNLLAAILGRTQLLLAQTRDEGMREELEAIQNTAAVGARMVRRLQDYLQGAETANTTADVNTLLRDAAELTRFIWRDQAEARGVVIDVVKDFADVPPAQITASALRQIFVALILNAVEALPNGGLITLRTERKGDRVIIAIVDNGVGMSDETRAQLGKASFTTKGAPHLGMGWHIVAKTLQQFQGTWSVESKLGRGTTVTLTLPIAKTTEGGIKQPMTTTRAANILVIDNEPSVRDLLARLLKLHGHHVVTAEGGSEGIATFKSGKFDLVLTDLGMPEMSGWDVAREIKTLNPRARVGLITGWPIDLTSAELRARGVDQIVAKPFDLPTLLSLIEDAMTAESKT